MSISDLDYYINLYNGLFKEKTNCSFQYDFYYKNNKNYLSLIFVKEHFGIKKDIEENIFSSLKICDFNLILENLVMKIGEAENETRNI